MTYTVTSATFANAEHTAIVVMTEEAGAVAIEANSTQKWARELWDKVAQSGTKVTMYTPPAAPVPQTITTLQMILGLWKMGRITDDEAKSAAQGVIPALFSDALKALPTQDQVAFSITWARMTKIDRSDPLVSVLAGMMGAATQEAIDQFFVFCSTIGQ